MDCPRNFRRRAYPYSRYETKYPARVKALAGRFNAKRCGHRHAEFSDLAKSVVNRAAA